MRTYPGRRRIAVLVFTAVVPASLTGCGGKTGSTTAPSGAAAQSGGVASTRPAPLPTQSTRTTLSGPGLLTLVCSSLNAPGELRLYDPSNAGQLSSLAVPEATPNGTVIDSLCGPSVRTAAGISKLLIRQRFNRDFSLIAYVTQMQADGSVHVGYTPLTGSAPAVDVTAATSAPGFGSTPPHDLNPVFDPDSSSLFFARSAPSSTKGGDDLQIFRYDLGTGTAAVVGAANVDVSSEGRLRESITVQAGHPVLGDLLLSPDGAVVATKGRGPDDQGGVRFFATPAGLVTDLPHQDPMGALEPGLSYVDSRTAFNIFGWRGNGAVVVSDLGLGPDPQDIFSVPVQTKEVIQVTPVDMLSRNSSANVDAVLSRDGSSMLFLSKQGDVGALYSVPTSQPTQAPRQIATIFNGALLSWQ